MSPSVIMITHLKEVAGLWSLHFLSTPPIHSLPYKLALQVKKHKRVKSGNRDREEELIIVCTVCDGLFLYSQSVLHTVQSKQHHVSNLDGLCSCDPSKNEWGVIITWQGLGWAHRAAQLKVIFTHNLKSSHAPRTQVAPQWKTLTERF